MKKLSSAELKTQQRQTRSLFGSAIVAMLIIGFALISTMVPFESLSSKILFSGLITAATLICFFFLVRWAIGMDEFERAITANAALVALYSSLLLLPWTFLHKLGFVPQWNVHIFFMFLWFIYVCAIFYYHFKD